MPGGSWWLAAPPRKVTSAWPSGVRTTEYVTSGLTATAVLDTSVHGVVVQTSRSACPASGPEVNGSRT